MKNPTAQKNFRTRKIVHYSLITCVLLIQLLIAGFFYNEFFKKKKTVFIENQLKELAVFENLTSNSQKELLNIQENFQKYLQTGQQQDLENYFQSINRLTNKLDTINGLKFSDQNLNKVQASFKLDTVALKKLKVLVDSTHQFSTRPGFSIQQKLPQLKKFQFENTVDIVNIETKTFSDTLQKKGLFGRLKDAISGVENVKKDSTVVTYKNGKVVTPQQIKKDSDSILHTINNYYSKEIKKIQVNTQNNQGNSSAFYNTFNSLMSYSNNLLSAYDAAIKTSKTDLEKELAKETSKETEIRNNLVMGLFILMFIVSILILMLTRIAFLYEKELKKANIEINENLKFKNRILGMLSHELRAPLKIVGTFINKISKKVPDPTIQEYLKSIGFTTNSLLMQANQILAYTKNQQIENKLVPSKFNLKNEIDAILNSLSPYLETRKNKLVVQQNIDADVEVFSDNTKINQLFMNIVGNANKFTENGEIRVNVSTQNIDAEKIMLVAEVQDNGAGISQTDLEKIFEPYYQGVVSADVENLGAGLGLSLCKELVALYPGEISISSKENEGTNVKFTIQLNLIKD